MIVHFFSQNLTLLLLLTLFQVMMKCGIYYFFNEKLFLWLTASGSSTESQNSPSDSLSLLVTRCFSAASSWLLETRMGWLSSAVSRNNWEWQVMLSSHLPRVPCDKFVYNFPRGFGGGLWHMCLHCLRASCHFLYGPSGTGQGKSVRKLCNLRSLRTENVQRLQSLCDFRAEATRR